MPPDQASTTRIVDPGDGGGQDLAEQPAEVGYFLGQIADFGRNHG